MHREQVTTLALNEIGRVELTLAQPIFFDSYQLNRATGSFVLVDPFSNLTVGAGMIRGEVKRVDKLFGGHTGARMQSPNVVWEGMNLSLAERAARNGHESVVVWLTGLSGAGKSTIARAVERRLFRTAVPDDDARRRSAAPWAQRRPRLQRSRPAENVRRTGEVAHLFFQQGAIVLCAFVSPFARDRDRCALFPAGRFAEIYVKASVSTLRARDVKGFYARESTLSGLTAYEPPEPADLTIDTDSWSIETAIASVMALVKERCRKR